MTQKTWYRLRATRQSADLLLYSEIGGIGGKTAADLLAELDALGPIKTLTVRINSPGGDVFDAIAMHNALIRHPATITCCIDGLCASAATLVALAGDTVCMADNAQFMIHEPWTCAMGNSADLLKQSDLLDSIATQITAIYARKTGASVEDIRAWMQAETWYTAAEAEAAGFVDVIDVPLKIAAHARHDLTVFKNAPKLAQELPMSDPITPVVPDPPTEDLSHGQIKAKTEAVLSVDPADRPLNAASIVRMCNMAKEPILAETLVEKPHTEKQIKARLANASAIRRICAIAKTPELADELIASNATADTAMLQTWQAMADRSAATSVDATPPPATKITFRRPQFEAMNAVQRRDFLKTGGILTD